MATGDKLVNLDELKLVYDKLHVPSVQVQIPTGQWSGSSTRTYTVNATNVTADTIVDWAMDSSINYLKADLTVTPGSGTIQFSTTAIPAGTINVTLFFPGVNGEVVIQTLADVYSKSQVDQKITQSTADAVAKTGYLTLNYTTWEGQLAALRAGLNQQNRFIAMFVCFNGDAAGILTNNNYRGYLKGYVTLSGVGLNLYDFFAGALNTGDMFSWRLTASDSAPTISDFRSYADYEKSTANTNLNGTVTGYLPVQNTGCAIFSSGNASSAYSVMSQLTAGRSVPFFIANADAASLLTGGKLTSLVKGILSRSGANGQFYDFVGGPGGGYNKMYSWRVTATSGADMSTQAVYEFTGTEI